MFTLAGDLLHLQIDYILRHIIIFNACRSRNAEAEDALLHTAGELLICLEFGFVFHQRARLIRVNLGTQGHLIFVVQVLAFGCALVGQDEFEGAAARFPCTAGLHNFICRNIFIFRDILDRHALQRRALGQLVGERRLIIAVGHAVLVDRDGPVHLVDIIAVVFIFPIRRCIITFFGGVTMRCPSAKSAPKRCGSSVPARLPAI